MEKKTTLRPSPTALLNPRIDAIFKAIFTQETKESNEALLSFITSVLGRKITNLKLTSNEPPLTSLEDKRMAFDVSVTFENGERASIEMQGRNVDDSFETRSEIQIARLLNNNAKQGNEWNAEKVYQISVLNFHLPKDDKCEMSWYNMKNQKGHELSGHLNVIYIDLLVIKKLLGTPVENLTPLQKWGLYFSYADDENQKDYIKQISQSEKGIMEADIIVGHMSEAESNWHLQNSRDIAVRDYNTGLSNAKKRGFLEGAEQKAIEVATNCLKEGDSPEKVSRCIGLSLEKVLELKKQLED